MNWITIWATVKRWARMAAFKWLAGKLGGAEAKADTPTETEPRFIARWFRWAVNRTTGRLALLTIGQSEYHGKAGDLPGCKLDAEHMARKYASYGAKVTERHNIGRVDTISEIKLALASHNGGTTVIHYSGHGSQIKDRTGTEPDGKMEVICCADLGLIGDDDLLAWANQAVAERGGQVILIYDTCHSGGMSRSVGAEVADVPPAARYVPEVMIPGERIDEYLTERHQRGPVNADPTTITVMMACEEQSYSYDTAQGGAYTTAWLRVADRIGNARAKDIHDALRRYLPSPAYPQTPQFAGREDVRVFG